jgi:virginiamycin A acetyltransferase
VGGIPAKEIRKRFDGDTIRKLQELKWWDWPEDKVKANLEIIMAGNVDDCH